MKTLIVYCTKYGSTEKCINILTNHLNGELDIVNLKENKITNLEKYDKVIIGGSIYIGQIQKEVRDFIDTYFDKLKTKKVGLFICCMREKYEAEIEVNSAYKQEILDIAAVKANFGGEFNFKKMRWIDKLIVKKVVKIKSDKSNIMKDNIIAFANMLNKI